MRTTLDIDDTVLAAARSLARHDRVSLGTAVSRLALRGLNAPGVSSSVSLDPSVRVLTGNPDHLVTLELVNEFRDD